MSSCKSKVVAEKTIKNKAGAEKVPRSAKKRPVELRSFNGNIWAFVISYLFSGTAYGLETITIPLYALSLKATTQELGLIQGGVGLGLIVMAIPAGFLVDKYGSRRPYIFCGLSMSAIMLIISQLKQPMVLVLAVTIASAVGTFNMISTNAAFYNSLDKIGKSKTGWYKGSLTIGLALIGPLTGGFVIKTYGFLAAFTLLSLLWLVPSVLATLFTKPSRKAGKSNPAFVAILPKAKEILSNRRLVNGSVLEGIGIAVFVIFTTFITVLSLKKLHLGPQHIGILFSLEGIAYALILFLGGKLLVFLSRKVLILTSFLGSTLVFAVFATSSKFTAIAAASVFLGFALGLLGLNSISALASVDLDKGSVAGFHGLSMGFFSAAGPVIAGFIGKILGLEAIFWWVVVFGIALIMLAVTSRFGREWLLAEDA